jgi:hypothetical protein
MSRNATSTTGYKTHPVVHFVAMLDALDAVPSGMRVKAMREFASLVRRLCAAEKLPVPGMVEMLENADEQVTADAIRQKYGYRVPPSDVTDV